MVRLRLDQLKTTRMIQQHARGAYYISIPKRLAEMREITPGQEATWRINEKGKLELTI